MLCGYISEGNIFLIKAYHCGFSQGFNVGEAVNYSVLDSLSYMVDATR